MQGGAVCTGREHTAPGDSVSIPETGQSYTADYMGNGVLPKLSQDCAQFLVQMRQDLLSRFFRLGARSVYGRRPAGSG